MEANADLKVQLLELVKVDTVANNSNRGRSTTTHLEALLQVDPATTTMTATDKEVDKGDLKLLTSLTNR